MTNERRPWPAPTLSKLIPPSVDHRYFEGVADHPFRPSDAAYSLAKAWWLAEASLLAYGDEAFIRERLAAAGLLGDQGMRLRVFAGATRGTQCFVADDDGCAIVAFRGTRIESFPDPILNLSLRLLNAVDLATDLDFRLAPGGHVHSGFSRALDEVWDDLRGHLDALGSATFWFTGHSLGAALASLAAHRTGGDRVRGVYTFGSPRVGDATFKSTFAAPCYRFVNNTDVVPHLPPRGLPAGFTHVGALRFIDHAGTIVADPTRFDVIESQVRGHLQAVKAGLATLHPSRLKEAGQAIRAAVDRRDFSDLGEKLESLDLDVLPFAAVADHMPIFYAVKLRDALARA